MEPFFDLHAHPTSKSFLSNEDPKKKVSPWKMIRGGILQPVAPILRSQNNFKQVSKANVKIGIYPIVPIEKGFSTYWLIEDLLGTLIVLSKKFLESINKGVYSYNDLFWDEISHMQDHLNDSGNSIKILKSIEDYDPSDGVTNGIISIEGSHALFGKYSNPVKHLIDIKNSDQFSALYLTLTHLTKMPFCNQAYGAKITKNDIFKPSDAKGIDHVGLDIVNTAYDKTKGKRILIDVKHMSVYSRFQFYRLREQKGYTDIPIMATHMGVTGFPLHNLSNHVEKRCTVGYYTKVTYKESHGIQGEKKKFDTDFNPWSINLYDEDIKIIVESKGLIGLSMDQRILGFGKNSDEYFAQKEFDELTSSLFDFDVDPNLHQVIESEPEEEVEEEDFFKEPDGFKFSMIRGRKRRHLRYLCNNILHIVNVGGENAWKHICIGSDFDGLINPINNCKSCEKYGKLESDLVNELAIMAEEGKKEYYITDLRSQVRDFMYNNGKRFLDTYYTKAYLNNVPDHGDVIA